MVEETPLKKLRVVSATMFLALLAGCTWVSFRADPMLATVGFLPSTWAAFLDLHPLARSFPAFFLMGFLGATATSGVRTRWRIPLLAFLLASPYLKDVAQTWLTATRHYNGHAVALGVCGAAAGWMAGCLITSLVIGSMGLRETDTF
jgi:hypothetical protein